MGGVDQHDSLLTKNIWYIHLFWYTTYICLTNAWLSYKRDCTVEQKICSFQGGVAASPVGVNIIKKRGRLSLDDEDSH